MEGEMEEEEDGEENEFFKATKAFHNYLHRCGLKRLLIEALKELQKNQLDTEDPILFMKTYFEVASGTGREFDKLKAKLESLSEEAASTMQEVATTLEEIRTFLQNPKLSQPEGEEEAIEEATDKNVNFKKGMKFQAGTGATAAGAKRRRNTNMNNEDEEKSSNLSLEDNVRSLTESEARLAVKTARYESALQTAVDSSLKMRLLKNKLDQFRREEVDKFQNRIERDLVNTPVDKVPVCPKRLGESTGDEKGLEEARGSQERVDGDDAKTKSESVVKSGNVNKNRKTSKSSAASAGVSAGVRSKTKGVAKPKLKKPTSGNKKAKARSKNNNNDEEEDDDDDDGENQQQQPQKTGIAITT